VAVPSSVWSVANSRHRRLLADYQSAVRPVTLRADKKTGLLK
jgi:hypothetical protein